MAPPQNQAPQPSQGLLRDMCYARSRLGHYARVSRRGKTIKTQCQNQILDYIADLPTPSESDPTPLLFLAEQSELTAELRQKSKKSTTGIQEEDLIT
ncbi:hypothetical protein Y032_0135g1942 [Ancylostoma ceylanicum]|uniref:Uncharacterized protein n=1 Tax=Ancylostoma ceylanicum TaxID=53326 RepID=A0A016T5W8_9BILA|nr:hypothetical protein Y032_0135g1942 [Ancylostoma ceylanicum]